MSKKVLQLITLLGVLGACETAMAACNCVCKRDKLAYPKHRFAVVEDMTACGKYCKALNADQGIGYTAESCNPKM